MTPAHLTNLAVHIACGTAAMAVGFTILAREKGTLKHRRLGRLFAILTMVVCLSAALGLAVFRFLPVFGMITVLVSYQLVTGWRAARTQASGPMPADALLTLAGIALSAAISAAVFSVPEGHSVIVHATLGAIGMVLAYDVVKWLFPRRWFARLWKYEHAYKLISALFGMLSSLVGNVVRVGQPWSQVLPSVVGALVIATVFVRMARADFAQAAAS